MQNQKDITIITTHINSDFDAVSSMLAAQKLYPEAILVFPGSQEKNLRDFFIKSIFYFFNMADIKDVDFSSVKKIVLVDTRQLGRIGKFASLLERSNIEIHIYDHHPQSPNDIKGAYEVIEPTGATVTILTHIIKEKNIDISPADATIMSLGIYEDTGSFTFSSTTEKDFMAAAFLLSKGANLSMVSNLIAREISPEQVSILNDMLQAATHYRVTGIDVVITTITTDSYVSDLAFLVQKMLKMENLNAIFAIARMSDKIYVVARSNIAEVDTGSILSLMGGGGHPFAASATIKGETLAQVEHRLIEILYEKIQSKRLAKDIMSSPAITINQDITCNEASKVLTRYNINALIVTRKIDGKDEVLGFLTRQVIEKALYHKLDDVLVKEYMNTEISIIGPNSDLYEIQGKIIENKQRILPVIENGILIGVITRNDLLNILVYQSQAKVSQLNDSRPETYHARTKNIIRFMKERLSQQMIDVLESIGKVAREIGFSAYVVGGFVRDLFLYRPNEDIDIVIEGNGIAFAKEFAKRFNAKVHTHEEFGTALIIFEDGFKVDVASARLEYYKFPAALPIVEMSSIKLDLFRRDFTINTLAIQITPERFGILIDFFGAQRDIKERAIRVLHNLSFVEDPTRIFRAIRFEQRFGFSIGKLTSNLILNAVKMDFFKRLSGRRVFSELRQIMEEENPTLTVSRLNDYNLLKIIHPSLQFDKDLLALFESVKKVTDWHDLLFLKEPCMKWAVYFIALIRLGDNKTCEEICQRFELALNLRALFCKERIAANRCLFWLENHLHVQNSVIYHKLSDFKIESILYMMAAAKKENTKKMISNFFTNLRNVRLLISGKDLKSMSIKPGPVYGKILTAAFDAKLNGILKTRDDELSFVSNYGC